MEAGLECLLISMLLAQDRCSGAHGRHGICVALAFASRRRWPRKALSPFFRGQFVEIMEPQAFKALWDKTLACRSNGFVYDRSQP